MGARYWLVHGAPVVGSIPTLLPLFLIQSQNKNRIKNSILDLVIVMLYIVSMREIIRHDHKDSYGFYEDGELWMEIDGFEMMTHNYCSKCLEKDWLKIERVLWKYVDENGEHYTQRVCPRCRDGAFPLAVDGDKGQVRCRLEAND